MARKHKTNTAELVVGIALLVFGIPMSAEGAIGTAAVNSNSLAQSFGQSTGVTGFFEALLVVGIVLLVAGIALVIHSQRGRR